MSNFFSSNLKFLREINKMSKSDLAKKLKVHQSTISRWENKEMGATVDNAFDVSETFNIPLPELLGIDLTIDDNYNKLFQKNNIQQIHKDSSSEISVMSSTDYNNLPNEVKADILKQALEAKQKMILEETEQVLNIKKELDNIEKKD